MSDGSILRAALRARVGALTIDATLEASGTLVILGPNGAGKSSLLLLLLGALPVERGHLTLGDRTLLDTARRIAVAPERRRIGYVPQEFALFPHLTVRENLAFALASAPDRLDRAARAARVAALLGQLDLAPLADRRPTHLSGGEKQRVALARALAAAPAALLLDEPLAALDLPARQRVRLLLGDHLRRLALPTVVVTHDPEDAIALGQRIAIVEGGKVVQCGGWAELMASPATPFVEQLAASDRRPDCRAEAEDPRSGGASGSSPRPS